MTAYANGAAERVCDWIDRHFPRRRRSSLRNAKRLALVLALARAELANQADLSLYARIVKDRLAALPVEFEVRWRVLQDPAARLGSLAALLISARDRARRNTTAYMADAKTRSVPRLLEGENEERARAGLAPLVATVKPGRRTLSIEVAGLTLADFPARLRDWDGTANGAVDPLALSAGASYEAHWRCHRCGHRWTAPVAQRTKRLTRCGRCHTERADGLNSLAAVHPEFLAEWDAEANAPLRPKRIKATYDKTVAWRCPDDPTHRATGCRRMRGRRSRSAARSAGNGDASRRAARGSGRHRAGARAVSRAPVRRVAGQGDGRACPEHSSSTDRFRRGSLLEDRAFHLRGTGMFRADGVWVSWAPALGSPLPTYAATTAASWAAARASSKTATRLAPRASTVARPNARTEAWSYETTWHTPRAATSE